MALSVNQALWRPAPFPLGSMVPYAARTFLSVRKHRGRAKYFRAKDRPGMFDFSIFLIRRKIIDQVLFRAQEISTQAVFYQPALQGNRDFSNLLVDWFF